MSRSSPTTLMTTSPPDRPEAISTESVRRRAMSSRMTRRSTTISMECFLFFSKRISSERS